MKIAQIAPLYESVPPRLYGGTERVVSYLTEALVDLGHEVTLYASGDSQTRAQLRSLCPSALRLNSESIDAIADHVCLVEQVFQESDQFDVVHSHIDYLGFPLFRRMNTPHLTTLHGRLDIPNLQPLYHEFTDEPLVSISNAQRQPLNGVNWQATVYHGLPKNLYTFQPTAGKYLAFIGRISPEKRVDRAIKIAQRAGIPLKIAAKVDQADRPYFEAIIKPLLDDPLIEFIGEIGEAEKDAFLGGALAMLFPVDWPEPFGLVMIEALACGTPVIACKRGSVPEVLQERETGFIFEDPDRAHLAVEKIPSLSRQRCREVFEERFTATRMAQDYLKIFEQVMVLREEGTFSRP